MYFKYIKKITHNRTTNRRKRFPTYRNRFTSIICTVVKYDIQKNIVSFSTSCAPLLN
jgi:hypothetical protein